MIEKSDLRLAAEALVAKYGRRDLQACAEMSDVELAEHVMAIHGRAVVSAETAALMDRIEQSPQTATEADIEALLYAIYSGPFGEYWIPRVLA